MTQNVQKSLDNWQGQLDAYLNEKNAFTDILAKAEKQTGVKRTYIVMGLAAVVALWLILGYGSHLLCQIVGFVWPAFQSIKAIESHNKDDDTKWLTYWVVYSTFSLVEFFTDIFLWWIPLYWFFKNQKKIDEALDKAQDVAQNVFDGAKDAAGDAAAELVRRNVADKSE